MAVLVASAGVWWLWARWGLWQPWLIEVPVLFALLCGFADAARPTCTHAGTVR